MPPLPIRRPGFIKRMLIHLAGADPEAFAHLPPSEGSDYAKLGATVLIPFALAIAAASFTIYTFMDEPKNSPLAIGIGVIWGVVILIMDIAMMSQLIVKPFVELPRESRRPFVRPSKEPAPKPTGGGRRFFLAFLRIGVAATLGTLMSHCIVLLVFKKKVLERVEQVRSESRKVIQTDAKPELDHLAALLAKARLVKLARDENEFLAGYRNFQAELGKSGLGLSTNSKTGAETVTAAFTEDAVLKPLADDVTARTEEFNNAEVARLTKAKEIDEMRDELLRAEEAQRNEAAGIEKTYVWISQAFQAGMPRTTSNIPGSDGPRSKSIVRAIKEGTAIIEKARGELKVLENASDAARQSLDTAKKKLIAAQDNQRASAQADMEASAERRRQTVGTAREALEADIEKLSEQVKDAEAQYRTTLAPVSGQGYDIWAQTEALHDLAFGNVSGENSKQVTIIGLVLLILLCLMFIDLTPLMMKMMRPTDYYGRYLAMVEAHYLRQSMTDGFTPPYTQAQPPPQGDSPGSPVRAAPPSRDRSPHNLPPRNR